MANGWSKWRSSLAALCFIVLALGAATLIFSKLAAPVPAQTPLAPMRPVDVAAMGCETGDIICRLGRGRWSLYFRDVSTGEKRFSHAGILMQAEAGLVVVHASADDTTGVGRVVRQPIAEFLAESQEWAVYRLQATPEQRLAVARSAESMVGVPFDTDFDLADATQVYCGELVYLAVNGTLDGPVVDTTSWHGREIVAVDNCYLHPEMVKVFDSLVAPADAAEADTVAVGASLPAAMLE